MIAYSANSAAVRLIGAQLDTALTRCPDWRYVDARGGAISRRYEFVDFAWAFSFMAQLALIAEKRAHHPEWTNIYNRIDITLTTHDAGSLTIADINFAIEADIIFKIHSAQKSELSCPAAKNQE
ncbi:4a-hydroxytetrahydrobiopterin dehydratase [Achromobacter xylosoxidans]|uniref:4a-hydroxytetrahydrobiopterin dehydratase n=1 Tax=Alcaligenes xylosoxydans xylosoxydans TaxID=85698 RepID=UPI000B490FA4|nr:4a-hydroxytetrahydrobiopterin dehydratase [Achromobacter xylosoxidans]